MIMGRFWEIWEENSRIKWIAYHCDKCRKIHIVRSKKGPKLRKALKLDPNMMLWCGLGKMPKRKDAQIKFAITYTVHDEPDTAQRKRINRFLNSMRNKVYNSYMEYGKKATGIKNLITKENQTMSGSIKHLNWRLEQNKDLLKRLKEAEKDGFKFK